MSHYFDLLKQNKDALHVECRVCINDETLQVGYAIFTNLHTERGIVKGVNFKSLHTKSKRQYRKALHEIKQATGRKFKLTATANSIGYTRLIYTLQGNK